MNKIRAWCGRCSSECEYRTGLSYGLFFCWTCQIYPGWNNNVALTYSEPTNAVDTRVEGDA